MSFGSETEFGSSARDLGATLAELQSLAGGFASEMAGATEVMKAMDGQTQRLSRSLGTSLRSAFDRAVFGGGKLSEVMRGLARDVAGRSLNAALRPVQNALGSSLNGLVGSLMSAFSFAQGGAFSAGRVRAFARGGIVDGPTLFPMRGGAGLMGEAGPEAVMPLTRGPDGRLGIAASGGSAGPVVTINITTPDIEGFQRSRGQIAAQLARAVSRGNSRL
ncbi:MAG: phage tail tape measure protein [Proteobacteria bacterium]|nr:phage tail tape measure protein [Pseudomonadota bacterium]